MRTALWLILIALGAGAVWLLMRRPEATTIAPRSGGAAALPPTESALGNLIGSIFRSTSTSGRSSGITSTGGSSGSTIITKDSLATPAFMGGGNATSIGGQIRTGDDLITPSFM